LELGQQRLGGDWNRRAKKDTARRFARRVAAKGARITQEASVGKFARGAGATAANGAPWSRLEREFTRAVSV
jgi:hypothetical protein